MAWNIGKGKNNGGGGGGGSSSGGWGMYFAFGIKSATPGAPGAASPGFYKGGLSGSNGSTQFAREVTPEYDSTKSDGGWGNPDKTNSLQNGWSFSAESSKRDLSRYRGRLLDYIGGFFKEKKDENSAYNIYCMCGINGEDGKDGIGEVTEAEESYNNIASRFYSTTYNVSQHVEVDTTFGNTMNLQSGPVVNMPAAAKWFDKGGVFNLSKHHKGGQGESGGAGSAGFPSLISVFNAGIIICRFNEATTLIRLNNDINNTRVFKNIVSGGGVDGFSRVNTSTFLQGGQGYFQIGTKFVLSIGFGDSGNIGEVKIPWRTIDLEDYGAGSATNGYYLPYFLYPLIDGIQYTQNELCRIESIGAPFGNLQSQAKLFGQGGGRQFKEILNTREYILRDFVNFGGYTGFAPRIYRDLFSRPNTNVLVFPSNIDENICYYDKPFDFSSVNNFIDNLNRVKPISLSSSGSGLDQSNQLFQDVLSLQTLRIGSFRPKLLEALGKGNDLTENAIINELVKNFKQATYKTALGSAPNNVPINKVVLLGPVEKNEEIDSKKFTMKELYTANDDYFPRNWYYDMEPSENIYQDQ